MSVSPVGDASEDSDSYHSFNDSDYTYQQYQSPSWKSSFSSDCDSDFESDHETGSLEEYSIETQPNSPKETTQKATLFDIPDPTCDKNVEFSSDSSACDGVSANNGTQQQLGRFKALKKFSVSPLNCTEEPGPICPRKVAELASKQVPDEELFDLDSPQLGLKDYLASDPKSEGEHKVAFTKIWVGWQQKTFEQNRSPLRDFSVALDEYINQDLTEVTSKTPKKKIVQPVVEPAETVVPPVPSIKPVEEYVSPFKNMPIRTAPPKVDGVKKPTIVPAGFDLTRLVDYRNPNHWARRQHVRTGDRI